MKLFFFSCLFSEKVLDRSCALGAKTAALCSIITRIKATRKPTRRWGEKRLILKDVLLPKI